MQYQVPQFIDVEDKIVGPLTLKQFIYIAIAFIIDFILFFTLQMWLWFIIASCIGGVAVALAFVKFNGRSFGILLIAALSSFWKPRTSTWQKSTPRSEEGSE